jgi:hypothetical protein
MGDDKKGLGDKRTRDRFCLVYRAMTFGPQRAPDMDDIACTAAPCD